MSADKAFFTAQPGETTMISWQGKTETAIPESIYTELEEKLNHTEDLKSRKKRFYYIAVECMQNIIRHQEGSENGAADLPVKVMIFAEPGNHFRIVTGNMITPDSAEFLKNQLSQLLQLNTEQLHEQYLTKLSENTISEKGGAGLGLIEIARKSENNIKYTFEKTGNNSFFSLEVTVK